MDVWEFCLCFGGALGYVRQCPGMSPSWTPGTTWGAGMEPRLTWYRASIFFAVLLSDPNLLNIAFLSRLFICLSVLSMHTRQRLEVTLHSGITSGGLGGPYGMSEIELGVLRA